MRTIVLLNIIFSICLFSCSSLSKNTVSRGMFVISGGRINEKQWNDRLMFHRFSWSRELTLLFDLRVTRVKETPFEYWLSSFVKQKASECLDFWIVLSYEQIPDKLSRKDFEFQMKQNGLEKIHLPQFKSHLINHPDYERSSLKYYQVDGYCRHESGSEVLISFPGYNTENIQI